MLGKLYKYEFKACGRVIFPIFGAAIIMSIMAALSLAITPSKVTSTSQAVIGVLITLVMIVFVFLLFTSMLLSFIFAIRRFKVNLLGKEGYLMNTLPVKPLSNVMAKLLCSLVFQILSVIVAINCILLCTVLSNKEYISEAFEAIGDIFSALVHLSANGWLNLILVIILMIVSVIKSYSMIYSAMSMGYSFNKCEALISIGLVIAFSAVESIITTLISREGIEYYFENLEQYQSAFALSLLASIIFQAIFASIYTALTTFFLKRRLNLE